MGLYEEVQVTDEYGNTNTVVTTQKVKVFAVMYKNGAAYRYAEGQFINFDKMNFAFNFQFVWMYIYIYFIRFNIKI